MNNTVDPYSLKADVSSLDEDLREQRRAKFDNNLAKRAQEWIFSVINEPLPTNEDLIQSLKNGVVLGKLANALGGNTKVKDSKMPFVQMENISQFIAFVKQYGVPQDEVFATVDLYEEGDIASVLQTIISFSRYAHEKNQQIPVIGPRLSKKQPPVVPKKPKNLTGSWSTVEYGYMKGASQSTEGVVFGNKRNIA